MADTFHTIAAPSEGVYREKMSKFMAFAHPAGDAAAAREVIARYQREYHDARHVCWAYMLGAARDTYQSNDNGEPSGTAGKPILGQINSAGLTNIVIVVVRYFGGIKLGTPGLTAAYREAARLAIETADIIECHETESLTFNFPYMSMNDVMRLAKGDGVKVAGQSFDNTCSMTLVVRRDDADALRRRLEAIDGLTFRDNDDTHI